MAHQNPMRGGTQVTPHGQFLNWRFGEAFSGLHNAQTPLSVSAVDATVNAATVGMPYWHVTVTGAPTGGTYSLATENANHAGNSVTTFGPGVSVTTIADIQTLLDGIYGAARIVVTGTDWTDWTATFYPAFGYTPPFNVVTFSDSLTGGTSPASHVAVYRGAVSVPAPAVTRSASPFNLLANPGAETGDTSYWNVSAGPDGITNAGASLSAISSDHNSGSDCFQLTIPSTPSQWRGMWQQINGLAANTKYTYTVFLKQGTFASTCIIAIRDHTNSVEVDSSSITLTGGWVQRTVSLTTGVTGNVSIVVTIEADQNTTSGGTILVDDAVLSRGDSVVNTVVTVPAPTVTTATIVDATVNASTVNATTTISAPSPIADANVGQLLGNGNAETTVTSPWSAAGGPGGITNAGASLAITSSDAHSGSNSFQVSIPGSTSQWRGIWQQIDGLAANTKYTYEVWIKQGTYTGTYIIAIADDTNGSEIDSSSFALSGTWTKRTVSVTTGPTGPVSIILTVEADQTGQSAGTFLVDDATLSKADQYILATTTVPAPSLTASATATPGVVNATTTISAPALSQDVHPSAVNATAAVDTPTVTCSASVAVSGVSVLTTIDTPAQVMPIVVTTVSVTTEIDAPTISCSADVTPSAVMVVVAVNDTAEEGSATVLADTVAAATTVNAPAITATANAPPEAVLAPTTVPDPTVSLSYSTAPDAVHVVVAIDAPTITASATVTPSSVDTAVTVPSPLIPVDVAVSVDAVMVLVDAPSGAAAAGYPGGYMPGGGGSVDPYVEITCSVDDIGVEAVDVSIAVPDPTIEAAKSASVTPDAVELDATVPSPAITASATASPEAVDVSVAVDTPTIAASAMVAAAAVAVAISVPDPAVEVGENASVTPDAVEVDATVPSPTITASATVTPAVVAASVAVNTSTITASASVAPTEVAIATSVPSATVSLPTTVSPDAVDVVVSVDAPQITLGTSANPNAVAATASVPAPSVLQSTTVPPEAVVASSAIPAPTLSLSYSTTPDSVDVAAAVPAPTIAASVDVHPQVVAAAVSIPAPSITRSTSVATGAVSVVASVPPPTTTASADVAVGAVPATSSVPSPAITATASVSASPVNVVVRIPFSAYQQGIRSPLFAELVTDGENEILVGLQLLDA